MDIEKILDSLHPLERQVLPVLGKETEFSAIIKASGLKDIEVMRALQWLANKEILKINESVSKQISLDKNGKDYVKNGLPEKRFLKSLKDDFISTDTLKKEAKLTPPEFGVSMGALKKKAAIITQNGKKGLEVKISPQGKKLLEKPSLEEVFLKKDFPIELDSLSPEEKFAYDNLLKRKSIIKVDNIKTVTIDVTETGKKVLSSKIKPSDFIDSLTPNIIKSGSWKNKKFRRYDVKINVPKIYPGKRHFVNEAIDYIKRIWLDLGFKEMEGNMIQTAFWDLDALFVPQDHPAREMQDTFYIKNPKSGKLPKELSKKIKAVHENGGDTDSKGWQSNWSEKTAKTNLLRTHTTVLSAHTLSKLKKENLPAKFFSVGKVFRNEALDWKHLFEFYQVDGIVIDPNANLKHLKGYLKEFYKKMGFSDVRMRPAHFPYTEPSLEVDVLHPTKNEWIELGGAGIFRPEVTKSLLGFECPVLAWGQGMGRIISEYWKITDIRDLYKNDLKQIREMKSWMR